MIAPDSKWRRLGGRRLVYIVGVRRPCDRPDVGREMPVQMNVLQWQKVRGVYEWNSFRRFIVSSGMVAASLYFKRVHLQITFNWFPQY